MFNKKIKLIIVFVLLFSAANTEAQINRNRNQNNIVLWGSTGYNNLPNDVASVRAPGGIGAAVGIGYEWHRNRSFILQTGVEFYWHNSRLAIDDFTQTFWMTYTPDESFEGRFRYWDVRDRHTISYLNLPLMLGFQRQRFYFLAGMKFGFNLQAQSRTTYMLKTTGRFEDGIGWMENIPGRFYTREIRENPNSLTLGFNPVASLEFGFYLGEQTRTATTRYRLALFADYGFMNINTQQSIGDLLLFEPHVSRRPVMNSFTTSDFFTNKNLNTFYIGLKFTVLFEIRQRRICLWNMC